MKPYHKGAAASIRKAYRWVSANLDRIPAMSYHEVLDALHVEGVRTHSYCGMD